MGWRKMMIDIDYIMNLLDWNNSKTKQLLGLKLAQNIKCISFFLQPGNPYGKRVWENCAKVLSERSDEELTPYLIELLEWLQDMNWPGAFCILDRIKIFKKEDSLDFALNYCMKCAVAVGDTTWEDNLREVK